MAELRPVFQDIADAIRAKGGTSAKLTPLDMPAAINNLPSGGKLTISPISGVYDSENGKYWVDLDLAPFGLDKTKDFIFIGNSYRTGSGGNGEINVLSFESKYEYFACQQLEAKGTPHNPQTLTSRRDGKGLFVEEEPALNSEVVFLTPSLVRLSIRQAGSVCDSGILIYVK